MVRSLGGAGALLELWSERKEGIRHGICLSWQICLQQPEWGRELRGQGESVELNSPPAASLPLWDGRWRGERNWVQGRDNQERQKAFESCRSKVRNGMPLWARGKQDAGSCGPSVCSPFPCVQ
jgi:hypothetical protein